MQRQGRGRSNKSAAAAHLIGSGSEQLRQHNSGVPQSSVSLQQLGQVSWAGDGIQVACPHAPHSKACSSVQHGGGGAADVLQAGITPQQPDQAFGLEGGSHAVLVGQLVAHI